MLWTSRLGLYRPRKHSQKYVDVFLKYPYTIRPCKDLKTVSLVIIGASMLYFGLPNCVSGCGVLAEFGVQGSVGVQGLGLLKVEGRSFGVVYDFVDAHEWVSAVHFNGDKSHI